MAVQGVGLPDNGVTRTPLVLPHGTSIMSLVLRIEGPEPAHTTLQEVWTALLQVAASLSTPVPRSLSPETTLPDDTGAALVTLALLRTASAAVPELVFNVSGAAVAGIPSLPVVLREGSACRPRRGALPSPDAHSDQQLVACVRAHWQHRSAALGLDEVLPRLSAPATGLVLRAEGDSVEVHNSTGSPLQDLVIELFGWSDGRIVDQTVSAPRSLAPGATARWPLSQLSATQCTARAHAKRVVARRSGAAAVSPTATGALVVVPLPSEPDPPCSLAVAVEDASGALLGVHALASAPPSATLPLVVSLAEPSLAARARWTWTQHRTLCTPMVPVASSDQPVRLDTPAAPQGLGPPLPTEDPVADPRVLTPAPAPAPAPVAAPNQTVRAVPPVTAAGSDRYARAEREPWTAVSALFPADSLDMDGRDRVRAMLQSQRVASIVAGCNISRATGWKTTVQTMRRLVSHDEAAVRLAAAAGIGALAGPAMEHLLVRLVEQDPDPAVREGATAALADLRSR